jgi:hypothetical protein
MSIVNTHPNTAFALRHRDSRCGIVSWVQFPGEVDCW